MRNQPVLALDPVTDVLTGGEIRQGSQRSRRPCADRSRDRRGVARSQEHLELLEAGRGGAPQNPRRQAVLPDTLSLNFQILEQQGKFVSSAAPATMQL